MLVRVAQVLPDTEAAGPGRRAAVWVPTGALVSEVLRYSPPMSLSRRTVWLVLVVALLRADLAIAQRSCSPLPAQPMNLKDFSAAASEYAGLVSKPSEGSRWLMCLRLKNPGLAGTLLFFRRRLQQPADVEAAFLHYVINSQAEPSLGDEEPETLRRLELR